MTSWTTCNRSNNTYLLRDGDALLGWVKFDGPNWMWMALGERVKCGFLSDMGAAMTRVRVEVGG